MTESQLTEVWLMGTRYFPIPKQLLQDTNAPETDVELEQQQFLDDYRSKIWCSYRKGFDYIGNTAYDSDSGWGCMLRSGQMLLSSALIRHFLGPKWRVNQNESNPEVLKKYAMIISWFLDRPGGQSPYSLTNIAIKGAKYDTPIGQWHGPTTTAFILKMFVTQHSPGGLKAYVSQDATVYKSEIQKMCQKGPNSDDWEAVLILLPVRLGIELNPIYLPFLIETFKFPQSLGFAGGKIGMSLRSVMTFGKLRTQRAVRSMYFVAIDDQNGLYYLDPHKTQDSINITSIDSMQSRDFNSYHYTGQPKKTTIDQIDPSLLLGFYCRNKQEFEDFCARAEKLGKEKKPPIFVLGEKRPAYCEEVQFTKEEKDENMKWQGTEEWENPLKPGYNDLVSQNNGNPRPQTLGFEMKELAVSHTRNGSIWGVIMLSQGYVVFEPLKLDHLVRKHGPHSYRWWIRVPFLESCKIVEENSDIEDRNSDDFILLHPQHESHSIQQPINQVDFGHEDIRHYTSEFSAINNPLSNLDSQSDPAVFLADNPKINIMNDPEQENVNCDSIPKLYLSIFFPFLMQLARGIGTNPNILKIVQGIDVKSLLMEELKSLVNWCHIAYLRKKAVKGDHYHPRRSQEDHDDKSGDKSSKSHSSSPKPTMYNYEENYYHDPAASFTQPTPEVVGLIDVIELVFLHGLKERTGLAGLSVQIYDFTLGTTSPLTFWPVIQTVISKENLEMIQSIPFLESEKEKCRAWIRLSLNEGTMYSHFNAIIADQKLLQTYYSPKAIFSDPSHCEVTKTLFYSLSELSFQLPIVGFDPEDIDNELISEVDAPSLHTSDNEDAAETEGGKGKETENEKQEKSNYSLSDIPVLLPPAQIRLSIRDGPIVESFDIQVTADKAVRVCRPILLSMEKFKVPMAK